MPEGKHRAVSRAVTKVVPEARAASAATGMAKHRAQGKHAAPDSAYQKGDLAAGRNLDTRPRPGPAKKPLYTPPSSRTRYIRYVGNQEASVTNKLIAEWLIGVIAISVAVPLKSGDNGYQKTMTSVMYRLTALTAVFFVLAIMANGRAAKVAMWAGLLIDLGIIFNATRDQTIAKIGDVFSGKSTLGSGHATPAADITHSSAPPVSPGFLSSNSAGNGGSGSQVMGA